MALRPEVIREARGVLRELVQHHLAELRKNAVLGYGADGGDSGGDMAMSQASAPCPDCGGAHPPGAAHLVKDAAGGQPCPDCGGKVEELGGVGGTDFYYCTGCGGALQRVADSGTSFQPVAGLNSVEKAAPYKGTMADADKRTARAINGSDKAGYTGMVGSKGGLTDNPRFQAANRRRNGLMDQGVKKAIPGYVAKDASSPPPQRGPNGMFPPGAVSSYVASIPHGGSHASRKADRVADAAEAHAARVRSKIPRTAAGATTHRVRTGDVRTVGAASPHLAAAHAAEAAADQAHSAAMATKAEVEKTVNTYVPGQKPQSHKTPGEAGAALRSLGGDRTVHRADGMAIRQEGEHKVLGVSERDARTAAADRRRLGPTPPRDWSGLDTPIVEKAGLTSPAAPAAPKGAPAPKPAAAAPPKPPMMAGIGKSAAAPAPKKYSLVPGVRRSFKVQPGSSTPAVAPKK